MIAQQRLAHQPRVRARTVVGDAALVGERDRRRATSRAAGSTALENSVRASCRRRRPASAAPRSRSPRAACRRSTRRRPAQGRRRRRSRDAEGYSTSSIFLVPGASVALDQRDRGGRPPGSSGVGSWRLAHRGPGLADRIDETPGRLDFVAAHEQRRVAADARPSAAVRRRPPRAMPKVLAKLMSSGTCCSRMPPGPGSLTIIHSLMPSSGCTRMTSRLAGMPSDGMSNMTCGTRRKPTDDLGEALRQPLAGAQVEGHARPSPVGDVDLQRDEGLGVALVACRCPAR